MTDVEEVKPPPAQRVPVAGPDQMSSPWYGWVLHLRDVARELSEANDDTVIRQAFLRADR